MRVFNDITAVNMPILEEGQVYIYVLENQPQGNIKIGRTRNIKQRLRALSGSNTGGNSIVRCAVSEATWLYTLEGIAHRKFEEYRINGTEWFSGVGFSFEEACAFIDSLFQEHDYGLCNKTREGFVKQHGIVKEDEDDTTPEIEEVNKYGFDRLAKGQR